VDIQYPFGVVQPRVNYHSLSLEEVLSFLSLVAY
jgi:hypothetical protein